MFAMRNCDQSAHRVYSSLGGGRPICDKFTVIAFEMFLVPAAPCERNAVKLLQYSDPYVILHTVECSPTPEIHTSDFRCSKTKQKGGRRGEVVQWPTF